MITNYFQDKELLKTSSYKITGAGYEIYIVRKFDIWRLYYFADSALSLVPGLQHIKESFPRQDIVCDIVGRALDLAHLVYIFTDNGFYSYVDLVRMKRKPDGNVLMPAVTIGTAELHHAGNIKYLLDNYFDKYAERIPTLNEVKQFISLGTVFINPSCTAFLIYEDKGQTSYLRYWFVHPVCRSLGMGSILLRSWLSKSKDSARQIFWVIQSNQNAIDKYKHYGFTEEDMIDIVLINKNLQYEAKDN
jgi:hypothetical protein